MAISAPFQRRSAIPLMEIVRFQETGFLNQCGANRVPGFLRFIPYQIVVVRRTSILPPQVISTSINGLPESITVSA